MAIVNFAHREIQAKIIWFGPPEAGLEVCLDRLYRAIPARERSRVHHFGASGSPWQSGYFDYAPETEPLDGFTTRVRVYTLAASVESPVHRSEVMGGADGVVFVADARESRANLSMEGMFSLERMLVEEDLRLAALPAAILVHQADAPTARSQAQVAYDLNPYGFPMFMAASDEDEGLLAVHDKVLELTLSRVRESLAGQGGGPLTAVHRSKPMEAADVVRRHARTIADATLSMDSVDDVDSTEGPVDAVVEVGCLPADLVGSVPLRILGTGIRGGRAQVDLLLQPPEATLPRRLRVVLAAREVILDASHTIPPPLTSETPPTLLPEDADHFVPAPPPEPPPAPVAEVPSLAYGVAGMAAGLVAGVLLGFLLFG